MKALWQKLKEWSQSGVPYFILLCLVYAPIASISMLISTLMLLDSTPCIITGFVLLEVVLISSTLMGYFTGRIHEINIKQRQRVTE